MDKYDDLPRSLKEYKQISFQTETDDQFEEGIHKAVKKRKTVRAIRNSSIATVMLVLLVVGITNMSEISTLFTSPGGQLASWSEWDTVHVSLVDLIADTEVDLDTVMVRTIGTSDTLFAQLTDIDFFYADEYLYNLDDTDLEETLEKLKESNLL